MTILQGDTATTRQKALAWSVHVYTASGALWGLLAILAAVEERWMLSFFWMGITMLVDGVDGSLARHFHVKRVVPNFDGALLDNIVDYFTYVLVPLIVVYQAAMVPANLFVPTLAMISMTSAFQFCQTDAKTDDHFFKGFPSYWNVVIIYLFLLQTGIWFNFSVLALCALLVFVPVKYIYPSRTRALRRPTMVLTLIWALMLIMAIALYPTTPAWLTVGSLFYILYYIGASLFLTFDSKRRP